MRPPASPPPQVSRRLARRLYSDLRRGRLGYVRLTAEAYMWLLREQRPEKSALLANELVVRSVVSARDWAGGGGRALLAQAPGSCCHRAAAATPPAPLHARPPRRVPAPGEAAAVLVGGAEARAGHHQPDGQRGGQAAQPRAGRGQEPGRGAANHLHQVGLAPSLLSFPCFWAGEPG